MPGASAARYLQLDYGAIEDMLHDPQGPVGKEMQRRGEVVLAIAQRLCPVDTGALRDSIEIDIEVGGVDTELRVTIGSDVYYASFVEFGTIYMAARPFLRPALEYA